MKIKTLLHRTANQLERMRAAGDRIRPFVVQDILERAAITLERKHIMNQLGLLLKEYNEKEAVPSRLLPFQQLLATRWEKFICDTDLSYPHTSHDSVATLCVTLAEELVASGCFQGISKWKLLMPTISMQNEVTLMEIEDLEEVTTEGGLCSHHFILSDDNTHLISVMDCLQYAALDGKLKHTHALSENGGIRYLTETETQRLLGHSPLVSEYYAATQGLYQIKRNGESFGAAINCLIERLRDGGVRRGRGGSDAIAGPIAIQGVKEFYIFLNTLEPDEKEMMYSAFATNNSIGMTLEICWLHLLCRVAIINREIELLPEEVDNILNFLAQSVNDVRSPYPCVELIASDLERILELHHEFFNIYPRRAEHLERLSIEKHELHVAQARERLDFALRNTDYRVLSGYGEGGKKRLLERIFGQLLFNTDDLKSHLNLMQKNRQLSFLQDILGAKNLKRLIQSVDDLIKLLAYKELYRGILDLVGASFIKELIHDASTLHSLVVFLPKKRCSAFLRDILGHDHIKEIIPTHREREILLTDLYFGKHKMLSGILRPGLYTSRSAEELHMRNQSRFFQQKKFKSAEDPTWSSLKRQRL